VRETEVETLRDLKIPVTLVIAGTEALLSAVGNAALNAQVLVAECGVAEATDTAAQMRPLVIVLPADVYGTDPQSFDALARDVRARVLSVPQGFDRTEVEQQLKELMLEAEAKRPSWANELGG